MKSGDKEMVDYILVNLIQPHNSQPDWQEALAYRKLCSTSGTQKVTDHKVTWKFDTEGFKNYGTGVYLYFRLIQLLFYTFLIISIISLPALLSNYKGDGLNMYGQDSPIKSLMKLSLGNQRSEEFNKIIENASIETDIRVSQATIITTDVVSSIVFFCFLVLWKIKSDEALEETISEDALPSYYTLKVRPFLPPEKYSQELMKSHFQKFGGSVAQIATVYDYDMILSEVKDLLKLVNQYTSASFEKKPQIYQQIGNKVNCIFKLSKDKPVKPAICMVTFEQIEMRNKIKNLYKYQVGPRDLQIDGKMPKVSGCKVEPSSIIWENFHLGTATSFRQSLFISMILAITLLAALVALFMGNARSTSVIQHQLNFSSRIDYSKSYSFRQAQEIGTLQVIFNFCSKLDYKNLTLKYSDFCKPYFDSYKQRFKGMIALSLLVVVINLLLNWIIYQLANFRRYKTKTHKSRFLILNIFILYFINTGILLMLIRLEVGKYSLGKLLNNVIYLPPDQFSIEPYSDFTRKWYLHIGSQVVTVYAVSLLISPFLQIVVNWIQMKIRVFRARRAKTQREMNQLITDSEFDFQTFYAMLLNACFVTMFYANAIPILYLLAAGAFVSLYIASFFVFKYFSCKPVMFDHTLNKVISKILCVALALHQVTSVMYFYTQDIFPLHSLTAGHQYSFWHKFEEGIGFLILGVFFLGFMFNYSFACKVLRKLYRRYYKAEDEETIEKSYRREYAKKFSQVFQHAVTQERADNGNHSTPTNDYLFCYKMEENPLYLEICYALSVLSKFQPHFAESLGRSFSITNGTNRASSFLEEPENLASDRPML